MVTDLLFQEVLLGPYDGARAADSDPGDDLGVREPVVLHDVAGDQGARPAEAGCKRGQAGNVDHANPPLPWALPIQTSAHAVLLGEGFRGQVACFPVKHLWPLIQHQHA